MSSVDYDKAMPKPRLRKAVVDDMSIVSEPMVDESVVAEKPKLEWKLKVITLRKGFYKRCRYEIGSSLVLDKKEDYGTWMKKILE